MQSLTSTRCRHLVLRAVVILLAVRMARCMPDPRQRERILLKEASQQIGGRLILTDAEQRLDALLHELKVAEMAATLFPPAMHFFRAQPLIERSPVFKILQSMPKGAALHIHSSALVSADWLVKNVTYRPNCYICFTWDQSVRFLFSKGTPFPRWGCSLWRDLETLRAGMGNPTEFDNSLMRNLTLLTEEPESAYPSQDSVWERFEEAFLAISGLITYAPTFRDYLYRGLQQLYNDNIIYLELRTGLSRLYELDGRIHDQQWSLQTYRNVTEQFSRDHPDFLGIRLIISVHRSLSVSAVKAAVRQAIEMRQAFPQLIAGFDLVGREDSGRPLWYFKGALSLPADLRASLPFFFHAGETDYVGTEVDDNLLDALLFNTSRIGHGYALTHHPLGKQISREKGVALEVCPISNQILKLVSDLRNHPAAVLMAEGHPMVLSSDDPGLFGTTGLSYDFYEAFVGIGGLNANLGTLKELAMNSIRYSSLSDALKDKALGVWKKKWEEFIRNNSP